MDYEEPFLSRWSRRKLGAKEDAPARTPLAAALPNTAPRSAELPGAAVQSAELPGAAAQSAELPTSAPVAPLRPATRPPAQGTAEGPSAEYREFFDPRVDEKLRLTALKKLFSDPQFNVMDGLDTYIDDYSKPDPIPAAMLRQLNQAKDLFLFDDDKQASESASDEASAAAGGTGPAAPVAAADTGALPQPSPASASDELAGAATSTAAAPPREGSRNDQKTISELPKSPLT